MTLWVKWKWSFILIKRFLIKLYYQRSTHRQEKDPPYVHDIMQLENQKCLWLCALNEGFPVHRRRGTFGNNPWGLSPDFLAITKRCIHLFLAVTPGGKRRIVTVGPSAGSECRRARESDRERPGPPSRGVQRDLLSAREGWTLAKLLNAVELVSRKRQVRGCGTLVGSLSHIFGSQST
jgi:hypothetical protein